MHCIARIKVHLWRVARLLPRIAIVIVACFVIFFWTCSILATVQIRIITYSHDDVIREYYFSTGRGDLRLGHAIVQGYRLGAQPPQFELMKCSKDVNWKFFGSAWRYDALEGVPYSIPAPFSRSEAGLTAPLWLPTAASASLAMFAAAHPCRRLLHRVGARGTHRCKHCGYSMVDLARAAPCPECGKTFSL
jgi:hypothetical protein